MPRSPAPAASSALSVRGRAWKMPPANPTVQARLQQLKLANPLVAAAVAQRTASLDQAKALLDAGTYEAFTKETLPKLSQLKDVEAAATRLADAVMRGEKIGISGDYDCDGNTSVALMTRFLMASGVDSARIAVHIPNREREGYGVNDGAVQAMLDQQIGLLVTLDNGTSAYRPIQKAAEAGLDVIVADHHGNHAADGLPRALVINPNRHDEKTIVPGMKDMAAVAVTFLLCSKATEILTKRGYYKHHPNPELRQPPKPKEWLGLVALGTVGDVVSVASPINRLLVTEGLKQINHKIDPYITALIECARAPFPITEETIAFTLAPIINAPGRLGQSVAWTFLSGFATHDRAHQAGRLKGLFGSLAELERDLKTLKTPTAPTAPPAPASPNGLNAHQLTTLKSKEQEAAELEQRFGASPQLRESRLLMLLSKECNEQRKQLEGELVKRAEQQAHEQLRQHPNRHTLLVAGERWHTGLIGVVAGRLKERFGLPVVVGSIDPATHSFKCSARSIAHSADIGESFRRLRADGLFDHAGGHPMAAGGSVTCDSNAALTQRITELREGLEAALGNAAATARQEDALPVAAVLTLAQWQQHHQQRSTPALIERITELNQLKPFGQGNPKPVIAIPDVYITQLKRSSDGKHLFFHCQQAGCDITLPCVAFHAGGTALEAALTQGQHTPLHLAGTFEVITRHSKQGMRPTLQLRVEDACTTTPTRSASTSPIPCLKLSTGQQPEGIFAEPTARKRA